jgi:CheY-like chemotaxis protein
MKTILIVDDEYPIVESLTVLLTDEGYHVVSASNGKEGLARLKADKPDMVLVDFMMPIIDGRAFVRRLRAMPDYRTLPVVMMSAARENSVLVGGGEGGKLDVSAFMHKPFLLETLLAAIRDLIGKGERVDGA